MQSIQYSCFYKHILKLVSFSDQYVFNNETKELHTGGVPFTCPPGGMGKAIFENMKKHAAAGLISQVKQFNFNFNRV